MADEEKTDESTNEEAVEEPAEEEEPSQLEVPETIEEAVPAESPAAEEAPPSTEEQRPTRRDVRISELLAQRDELRKQVATQTEPEKPSEFDYKTALDADPTVIQQIEAEAQRRQDLAFQQGLTQGQTEAMKTSEFLTRLEIDTPKMLTKYPKLDPEAPEFDAAAAHDVNSIYLALVGYDQPTGTVQNSRLRYADFVQSHMTLADRLASTKVEESSKNIAKQAATTALRPDGSTTKRMDLTKAPDQMTTEELAAAISQGGIPTTVKK